jgi:hypothetical protein
MQNLNGILEKVCGQTGDNWDIRFLLPEPQSKNYSVSGCFFMRVLLTSTFKVWGPCFYRGYFLGDFMEFN